MTVLNRNKQKILNRVNTSYGNTYIIKPMNNDNWKDNNSVYIIFAELYKFDYTYSMLNLFISPVLVNKNILINNNIIFLKQSDDYYNLIFENANLSRILKLLRKTNDSEVITINGDIILNNNNLYYELSEENIQKGILLKIKNNNCLL